MTGLAFRYAFVLGLFALLLIESSALQVQAQAAASDESGRAAARELGRLGLAALDANDFATADQRLSQALDLYDAPTLRLARARARRGLGHWVAACEDYRATAASTAASTDPATFADARRDAAAELAALEPAIPTLTVSVSGGTAAALTLGGVPWLAAVGQPKPIDPGTYALEATAQNGQKVTQNVALQPSQPLAVTIALPGLQPSAAGVAASDTTAAPAGAVATTKAESAGSNYTSAWVMTGVTGVMLVAAVITGAIALGKKSDFDNANKGDMPGQAKDLRSKASTMEWINTAFVGATLISGGVTTYLFVSNGSSSGSGSDHAGLDLRSPKLPALGLGVRGEL